MTPLSIGELGDRADAVADLVERATRSVAYYDHHISSTARRGPFTALPTSTKADLQAWGTLPLHAGEPSDAIRFAATSGTTGPRMLIGFSAADWERLTGRLAHRARAASLGPADVFVNTHGYGLWIGGPSLDALATAAGAALVPSGPGATEQLLRWLTELPITALSATPSFLRLLAGRADGRWALRVGFVGGECASIALRREVVDALGGGFAWQELYGSTEAGGPVLGWSPPDDPFGGRLLLDSEEFVVEILGLHDDQPVGPGDVGELVITTPWREQSPLVRYRTRDLVRRLVDDLHPSGFPVTSSVIGRVDDAIKVRGTLVYPAVVEQVVVAHCPPGAEWRVEIDRQPGAMDTLTVVVEHDPSEAEAIAHAIHSAVGVRALVRSVDYGTLERFEGKARRTIDRR